MDLAFFFFNTGEEEKWHQNRYLCLANRVVMNESRFFQDVDVVIHLNVAEISFSIHNPFFFPPLSAFSPFLRRKHSPEIPEKKEKKALARKIRRGNGLVFLHILSSLDWEKGRKSLLSLLRKEGQKSF